MKKSLAALAALAACSAVSAQSTVTLFGVVDAAIRSTSNKSESVSPFALVNSVKASRTELANSGLSSSRLGFRGVEDLGGGLAASFWLEAPITNDDGATGVSTFSRRSTVSFSGGFGEVRLGRDYTPESFNDSVFDPFGDTGIGGTLIVDANESANIRNAANTAFVSGSGFGSNGTYKRASNMVQYYLPPNLGGFYGSVAYALHEQTDTSPNLVGVPDSRAGRHVGGRFGYANGPLDLAIAFGRSDTVYSNLNGKIKTVSFGGTYDFGPVKVFGEYSKSQDSRDAPNPFTAINDVDLKGYLVGVTVPVGPGVIRASYSQVKYDYNNPLNFAGDPKANKFALGYVHNLSKRTAVYGTLARVSNKNGAGLTVGAGPSFVGSFGNVALAPKTSTGYEFGVRHSF